LPKSPKQAHATYPTSKGPLGRDGDVYEELELTAEPGLTLLVYTSEPASASQERLRRLAGWAGAETEPAGPPVEHRDR
jgi:hypothetical protein